jgi:hypothetical protein
MHFYNRTTGASTNIEIEQSIIFAIIAVSWMTVGQRAEDQELAEKWAGRQWVEVPGGREDLPKCLEEWVPIRPDSDL